MTACSLVGVATGGLPALGGSGICLNKALVYCGDCSITCPTAPATAVASGNAGDQALLFATTRAGVALMESLEGMATLDMGTLAGGLIYLGTIPATGKRGVQFTA